MKRTIIYFSTLLAATTLSAETLTPTQALARVKGSSSIHKIASRAVVEATPMRVVALDSEPEMYLFTPAEGGLLLVSAESETPALIGYSDNYTAGEELPPALEGMMRIWASEIEAQRAGNVIYKENSRAEEDFAAIEPICSTRWNQDAPYNGKCPVLGGSRTYTGCVATAMAQVLKVYQYPEKCSGGTYSYYWNAGGENLSLNFDDVTLDWANMLNTYPSSATQAQKDAVATLMQALGYSSNMNYHTDGSGTAGIYMAVGLARNFDYDAASIEYANRASYSLSDWQRKVYNTLAEGYPVYYDGATMDAQPLGHAFVVDGYRSEGYFHLNWGWGGMSDGYFLLTALDPDAQGIGGAYPSAGFDAIQGAIFGLKKGNDASAKDIPLHISCSGGFNAGSSSAVLGKNATFSLTDYLINSGIEAVNPYLGVIFRNADGTEYKVRTTAQIGTLQIGYGYGVNSYSVTVPSGMADGKYTVLPAAYSGTSQKYYPILCNIGSGTQLNATVSNGTITFESPILPELSGTIESAPEKIYVNKAFSVSGSIEGLNAASYYGEIKGRLYRTDAATIRANIGSFMGSIDGNSSSPFQTSFILERDLTSGEYDLALTNENGKIISNRVRVEVVSAADDGKLTASDMKVLSTQKNNLQFEVTLTASEGNFSGPVYIQLHQKGNYNEYVARIESESIDIPLNAKKTITISGEFENGVVGMSYTPYVYYYHLGEWTEAAGRQRKSFTLQEPSAINEIEADRNDTGEEYFDLTGRRIASPTHGLYIRKSRTTSTTKLIIK